MISLFAHLGVPSLLFESKFDISSRCVGLDERAQVSADWDVIRARFLNCGLFRKKIFVQVAAYNWVEGVD